MSTAVIVVAGGAGTRMGSGRNKVYLPLAGRPLLAWSLDAFEQSDAVAAIALVIRAQDDGDARRLLAERPLGKVTAVVAGGATRHDSERAGLEALAPGIADGRIDVVLIHDAARPLVSPALIARVESAARDTGGAVPGLRVEAGVVFGAQADGSLQAVPAADIRRVQTPQGFRAAALLAAYRAADAEGFRAVDTAACVKRYTDLQVRLVEGDPVNRKVTYPEDLAFVEQSVGAG